MPESFVEFILTTHATNANTPVPMRPTNPANPKLSILKRFPFIFVVAKLAAAIITKIDDRMIASLADVFIYECG